MAQPCHAQDIGAANDANIGRTNDGQQPGEGATTGPTALELSAPTVAQSVCPVAGRLERGTDGVSCG